MFVCLFVILFVLRSFSCSKEWDAFSSDECCQLCECGSGRVSSRFSGDFVFGVFARKQAKRLDGGGNFGERSAQTPGGRAGASRRTPDCGARKRGRRLAKGARSRMVKKKKKTKHLCVVLFDLIDLLLSIVISAV